jgi:tetratricopeptide (TPR) repeat protein
MKKLINIIALTLLCNIAIATNADSIAIKNLETKLEQLDNQLKEVRRDELNYQIEKDLLKETYSNNYSLISLVITIVLGIIGLFGYLGLKDINAIKKEYTAELGRLGTLKGELEQKIKEFGDAQVKYDKDITAIIKQNENNNRKIEVLEFKSKINSLFKEKKYATALESCLEALQLEPDDISLLMFKARIYSITRSYPEAIQTYLKIIKLDANYGPAIVNLAETYILNNQNKESETLIETNAQHFKTEGCIKAIQLFKVIRFFNENKLNELIEEIKSQINPSNLTEKKHRFAGWDLEDVIIFIGSTKESKLKSIVESYIAYMKGELSGMELNEII